MVEGGDIEKESYDAKSGRMINSDFLNGMDVKEAITRMFDEVERRGLGKRLVNYRLRDAIFSRQRYWGEPFPVYYKDGMPYMIDESCLPLELPEVAKFLPTETGEPPLGNATRWAWDTVNNCVTDNDRIDNQTVFPPRTLYDARFCWFISLLLALYGPSQRCSSRRQSSR